MNMRGVLLHARVGEAYGDFFLHSRGLYCAAQQGLKTILARWNFDGLHVWHNERTLPQDAEKGRPARPQRVKGRGVPSGVR